MQDEPKSPATDARGVRRRPTSHLDTLLLLVILVAAVGTAFWTLSGPLSLHYLAEQESSLRTYRDDGPLTVAVIGIAIYVAVAGFSLPGASALSLAYGWYFGFWQGLLVVSFGSTGGAMLAFLLSRYLFRAWVQERFAMRLATVNSAFDRDGALYLFTLRLIPAIPFFLINVLMGLTKIPATTFWWVSQVGMLPGTAAYVYAGASVPSLQQLASEGVGTIVTWRLFLALAILGLLPWAIKRAAAVLSPRRYTADDQPI